MCGVDTLRRAGADELRLAVRDALCRTDKRKKEFKDAVFSLEATEGPIGRSYTLHQLRHHIVYVCLALLPPIEPLSAMSSQT